MGKGTSMKRSADFLNLGYHHFIMGKKTQQRKKEELELKRQKRRTFLKYAMACGILSVPIVYTGNKLLLTETVGLEKLLEQSRNNRQIRQHFLDKLLADSPIAQCERIIYDPGLVKNEEYGKGLDEKWDIRNNDATGPKQEIIAAVPISLQYLGRPEKMPIFVDDLLFERLTTDGSEYFFANVDDVKSYLIDHEGQHVVDVCDGIVLGNEHLTYQMFQEPPFPQPFFTALRESRAYYNQLRRMANNPRISRRCVEMAKANSVPHFAQIFLEQGNPGDPQQKRWAREQTRLFHSVDYHDDGETERGVHHISVTFPFLTYSD